MERVRTGFSPPLTQKAPGVETSACCFQLDKGFTPVKKTALFRRDESGEIQYAGYAVVFIFFVRSEVTESGHGVPLFRMVPAG